MSKSKSKTTSNTTSATNSTTTPTVAPWLNTGYQGFNDLIGKYAASDPSQYVAGTNPVLAGAMTNAQGLGSWQDSMQSAIDGLSGLANGKATTTLDLDRSAYTNPYIKDVLDTTLADYDVNSGRTRAAQAASAAANRAFGSSRYGVREAQTESELARGRATTSADIRDRAYQQATAQMSADADRQNAAAQRALEALNAMGNFGSTLGQGQRADVATQLGAGQIQQGIDQAQAQALPDWLKNIGSMYGSIPISAFTSLNETGTSNSQGTATQVGKPSALDTWSKFLEAGGKVVGAMGGG